jgi:site-specific recombinase XerD
MALPAQFSLHFDPGTDVPAANPEQLEALFLAWVGARAMAPALKRQQRSLSPASRAVYSTMWQAFCAFVVAERLSLDSVDAPALQRFVLQRQVSARHARRLLVLVDWLLTFDAQREEKAKNTAAATLLQESEYRFAEAKDKTPLPQTLDDAQVQSLLERILTPVKEGTWARLRNQAMVAVMLGGGLKPGETVALPLTAIHYQGEARLPYKLVLPARDRTPARETPLAPYARQVLAAWLAKRGELGLEGTAAFPARRRGGGILTNRMLLAHYASLLEEAHVILEKHGALALRHSFAVRNLKGGKPLAHVQHWLGVETPEWAGRFRRKVTGETSVV